MLQSHLCIAEIQVAGEESLDAIQGRYIRQFNSHAKGYLWKRLGQALDMALNLEKNGVPDESARFAEVGDSDDDWLPALYLYFSDDLTEQ